MARGQKSPPGGTKVPKSLSIIGLKGRGEELGRRRERILPSLKKV